MNDARPDRQSAGADFPFSRPEQNELQASSTLDAFLGWN